MQLNERTRNVVLALALAVAAALIIILAVKKSGHGTSTTAKGSVSVVVASHDIAAHTPGSELSGAVKQVKVPAEDVVAGAVSNVTQVRNLVSTAPIYAGEQITIRRFQPEQSEGISGQISSNERAVQVPGDANQLLVNTLKTGDHVDLIGNIKYKLLDFHQTGSAASAAAAASTSSIDLVATRAILRNLLVLQGPQTPAGSGKFGSSSTYQVQLQVTDSQAEKLFFIMKNADWTLALRPAHAGTDSPENVETTGSVLIDGLQRPQFLQLVLGPTVPQ